MNPFEARYSFESTKKVTVGDLLHLFCSDLEEEITHRKYFYKSAPLVREGMIIVQNFGLSGDTNNAEVSQ